MGNLDILYAAVVEILRQLGIGDEGVWGKLERFRYPVLANTAGVVTGGAVHEFRVRQVDGDCEDFG